MIVAPFFLPQAQPQLDQPGRVVTPAATTTPIPGPSPAAMATTITPLPTAVFAPAPTPIPPPVAPPVPIPTLLPMATPIPVPTTVTAPSPATDIDISGRWDSPNGGFVVFTRLSPLVPGYEFLEYDLMGAVVGEGSALLEGSMVYIQYAYNNYIGDYTAVMNVSDSQMLGVLEDTSMNRAEIYLYRSP